MAAVTAGVAALTVTDGTLLGVVVLVVADETLAVDDVMSTFVLEAVVLEELAVRRFVEPPFCVVFEALVEAEELLGRPLGGPEGVR